MVLLFEKDTQYPCGHMYLPASHPGLRKLGGHWELDDSEVQQAGTFLCSALIAASPNIDAILSLMSTAPQQTWVQQLGFINMASLAAPVFDATIEVAILKLIDSLNPLLASGLVAAVPWLAGHLLLPRLVFCCTQALLQRGREVVCGRAAYALGRDDCHVLCNMSSDSLILGDGFPPTLFSLVNLMSPTAARHFGRGSPLFSERSDTNHNLSANGFLIRHYEEGTCELSALLSPYCPNSAHAPNSLSTRHPESFSLRLQQARFMIAVASAATHHMHSLCGPDRQLEVAAATGHDASDVYGGAVVQKEQCIPCEWKHQTAGSVVCFCSASSRGIDMTTLYPVVLDGLEFALSPAALNLACMLAQPPVGNVGARDQAFLLAQIISRASGDLSGRMTGGMQLLSAQQRQRKNRLSDEFYEQFAASTFDQPNYSAHVAYASEPRERARGE